MMRGMTLNNNEKLGVLIVDDHEVVRAGYRRLFEAGGDLEVAAEAASGEEAVELYKRVQPRAVVMDIAMPGIGGLQACRHMLAFDENARILVVSVHESAEYVNRALDAGVLGYISKRSAARNIVNAIKQVAEGRMFIGEELREAVANVDTDEQERLTRLSAREFDVLRYVAEGHSVNETAELLKLSPKTTGHHYTSLRKKLGVTNLAQLIRLAIRNGIVSM